MKQVKTSQKRFTKKAELIIFALSASMSFILLLFSPVIVYMEAPEAFMVDVYSIVPPMLLVSAAATAVLAALLNLCLLIGKAVFRTAAGLLVGFETACTVQPLFFNRSMNVVLSTDRRYDGCKLGIFANSLLFWTIVLLPAVIAVLAGYFPDMLEKVIRCRTALIAAAVLFLINGTVALGRTVSAHPDRYKGVQNSYLSYEPALSLSDKGNVVVFLTDRLDGVWMDELLEKYPALNEKFADFTFYQNNISVGTSTFPTVPQMLTNSQYNGEEWYDYLKKAWRGDTLTKRLSDNGYSVYLLPDSITTLSSVSQVRGQCDNIRECSGIKLNTFGKKGIVMNMTRLGTARVMPFAMKHKLQYWMGANFCRDMVRYPAMDDLEHKQASLENDLRFAEYLKKHSIKADSAKKTFSFIHLNCSHTVDDNIAGLHGFEGENDVYKTTRGDFEILFEYFRQMKAAGVYDSSTIIVLGDHGRAPRELSGSTMELDDAITAALLIKPAGAHGEALRKDSESELSIAYFAPGVLEYAGVDRSGFGVSYNDVINGSLKLPRFIRGYDFAGYGRMVEKAAYTVSGDARDFSNWSRIKE